MKVGRFIDELVTGNEATSEIFVHISHSQLQRMQFLCKRAEKQGISLNLKVTGTTEVWSDNKPEVGITITGLE